MAERQYQEGDEVTGPGGPDDVLVLKDNKWVKKEPSSTVDAIRSIPGGLVRGGVGLITTPFNLADVAARGAEWGARHLPESQHETADKIRRGAQAVEQAVYPGTYQGGMEQIEKDFGKFYEPQTMAGRLAEGAAEFAPTMFGGPGGFMIKALRGLGRGTAMSAAGEAASQAGKAAGIDPSYDPTLRLIGAAGTMPASALARKVVTPNPVTSKAGQMRLAQTERLKNAGVDVDAAQALNSPRMAMWAGRGAPPGQAQQLSDAMLATGGATPTMKGLVQDIQDAQARNFAAIQKQGSMPLLQRREANLGALEKAANKARTQPGSAGVINPSDVLRTTRRWNNDLTKLAEAGVNVAQPITSKTPNYTWARILGGLPAAGPGLGIVLHGGMPGLTQAGEAAVLGIFGQEYAPHIAEALRKAAVQPMVRSQPGIKYLTNQAWMPGPMSTLDPAVAARLLASPNVQKAAPESGVAKPLSITVHPKHFDEENVTTVPRSPSPYPVVPLSQ
jgi:hypothetical protein